MNRPPVRETLNFVVQFDVSDNGQCDPHTIRKSIQQAVEHFRDEGSLTDLDDESTEIHSIQTALPRNLTEAVMLIMGDSIDQTPEAKQALETALNQFRDNFHADRAKILSGEDREFLISFIVADLHHNELNESANGSSYKEVLHHGHPGWNTASDEAILRHLMVDNTPALACSNDDGDRIRILEIFTRPEIWQVAENFVDTMPHVSYARDAFIGIMESFSRDDDNQIAHPEQYAQGESMLRSIHARLDHLVMEIEQEREHPTFA